MIDLIFVVSQSNRNSIAALLGTLDTEKQIIERFNIKLINEKGVEKEIKSKKKKIICFSFQTPDVFKLQPLIRKIKKDKETLLIAGGAHPSGSPQHTLKMGFDFAFIGESEETFKSFLEKYHSSQNNYEKINGIAFKQNSKFIVTEKAKPVDITKYLPVSERFQFFTPIEITRGCPYGCRFCQTTYLFGKIRHRTIKQIIDSAKILTEQGWTKIRFISPNILSYGSVDGKKTNLPELKRILESVRKINGVEKIYAGSFPSEIRPENVTKEALSILKKYANNDNIIIGLQSGSNNVLKRMHRQHTVREGLEAIEKALEIGFKVNVDFIFGTPGETKENEKETIEIIKKLTKLQGVRIHGHTFLPLPGTPWENEKAGKISDGLKKFLKGLIDSSKVYGDWEKQEQLSKMISHLLKK